MCDAADQFEAMQDEVYRRREECAQLQSLLESRNSQLAENAVNPLLGSEDIVELKMAYKSQCDLKKFVPLAIHVT